MNILHDQRGSVGVNVLLIILVVAMLGGIVLEFSRVLSVRDALEYECQRAVNTALEFAMLDEYRQDGLNVLDPDLAELQFNAYFTEFMDLSDNDGSYIRYDENGEMLFILTVDNLTIRSGAAADEAPYVGANFTAVIRNAFRTLLGGDTVIHITVASENELLEGGAEP